MRVRMIHGIHSKEGDNNMSAFKPYVQQAMPRANVSLYEYGFMGFWAARWNNMDVAHDLAAMANIDAARSPEELEVWITHSNGGAVAYLAAEHFSAKPDMIININPALDRNLTPVVQAVETVHSDSDRAVYISQWLPFHIWGDQGKVGYKGRLQNTLNINASKIGDRMAYHTHCGMFADHKRMEQWAQFFAQRITERLGVWSHKRV